MPRRKQTNADEKVGLMLSAAERKLLLVAVVCFDGGYEEAICTTPIAKPIMLTLDRWDDLGGYIAAEANHSRNTKLQRKLDAVFCKIDDLVSSHSHEEPRSKLKIFRPDEE